MDAESSSHSISLAVPGSVIFPDLVHSCEPRRRPNRHPFCPDPCRADSTERPAPLSTTSCNGTTYKTLGTSPSTGLYIRHPQNAGRNPPRVPLPNATAPLEAVPAHTPHPWSVFDPLNHVPPPPCVKVGPKAPLSFPNHSPILQPHSTLAHSPHCIAQSKPPASPLIPAKPQTKRDRSAKDQSRVI